MYSQDINRAVADGSRAYSARKYEEACDSYAEACQLFSEQNGQEDPDLLFLYGKALFQCAVSKSEVFGGVNEEKEEEEEEEEGRFHFEEAALAEGEGKEGEEEKEEEVDEKEVEKEGEKEGEREGEKDGEKEVEKEGAKEGEKEGEKLSEPSQSDFEVAWEILDLTRNLLENKLEKETAPASKPYLSSEKSETEDPFVALTKKLSETYDLLGEVSLEAENFQQSAIDLERSLELRRDLYPPTSPLVSESHYKLSLALEFCVEDPDSRKKAAEQMRLAVDSVKARAEKEEDPEKRRENEELVKDLEVRLADLSDKKEVEMLRELLGEGMGERVSEKVNELVGKKVNDLTGNVKRRKTK